MRRIRESLKRWGVEPIPPEGKGAVILCEPNPQKWVARWAGALLEERPMVLLASTASASEHQELRMLLESFPLNGPWILVPTSGTTGKRRWVRHSWETLSAAANGFLRFFGVGAENSVCVLPLHHVGGMMTVVRAIIGGGNVSFGDYREIGHSLNTPPGVTVSLVPTQLSRLLFDSTAVDALGRAGHILIGGAHAPPELLVRARDFRLRLVPSYGMTETAAVVAALRPERFLAGEEGVGEALPHVGLHWGERVVREGLLSGARRLGISAPSLCHGYWPEGEPIERSPWWTSDAAVLRDEGGLQIVRRLDRVIITGGENVDAERVEQVLSRLPAVRAVAVVGIPDAEWGQRVVAAVEVAEGFDPNEATAELRSLLAPHERPKELLILDELPRTPLGKLDTLRLTQLFCR